MKIPIAKNDWAAFFKLQLELSYMQQIESFLEQERIAKKTVFPPENQIFRAFELCSFQDLKVVILGQDPYHGQGQANGLAFSVPQGIPLPPSLRNIFKELESSGFGGGRNNGDLQHWAGQGVLLLNTCLTVEGEKPASHKGQGWEEFTEAAIKHINANKQHVVYMLWGAHAQKYAGLVDAEKNKVLTAPHPSPLSAYKGFLGCKHFENCNAYLKANDLPVIEW